jgi:hypothetical protein
LDIAPFREGECLESKFRDDSAAGKDVMPETEGTLFAPMVETTLPTGSTLPTQTTLP